LIRNYEKQKEGLNYAKKKVKRFKYEREEKEKNKSI
jgi:hypothetical protein